MSEGLNKVLLLGNLGADAELKVTQGGKAVLRLRLATTESYIDARNERVEKTEWHTVIFWGRRAEGLAKILAKGDRVCIEGKLQTRSWEQDGSKRFATEVVGVNAFLCGSKNGNAPARAPSSGGGGGSGRGAAPPPPANAGGHDAYDYEQQGPSDDEIPFMRVETRWDRP